MKLKNIKKGEIIKIIKKINESKVGSIPNRIEVKLVDPHDSIIHSIVDKGGIVISRTKVSKFSSDTEEHVILSIPETELRDEQGSELSSKTWEQIKNEKIEPLF